MSYTDHSAQRRLKSNAPSISKAAITSLNGGRRTWKHCWAIISATAYSIWADTARGPVVLPLQEEEVVNLLWFGVKSGSETNRVCMDILKTAINIIFCAFAQAD